MEWRVGELEGFDSGDALAITIHTGDEWLNNAYIFVDRTTTGEPAPMCLDDAVRLATFVAATPDLFAALMALIDNDPCRLDHHGYCQTHGASQPCVMAQARVAVAKACPWV